MTKGLKSIVGTFLVGFWAFDIGSITDLGKQSVSPRVAVAAQYASWRPRKIDSLRQVALALVNQDRARYGLRTLKADSLLSKAAQKHAEDMLRRHYFSHYSPEGRTPSDRFATVGGRGGAAENLLVLRDSTLLATGIDNGRLVFFERSWMNSPEHRQNLLDPRYGRFGFGLALSGDRLYAVQLFSFPS